MPYEIIDVNTIKVGDPITKELFDKIKNNFDDLDSRVNQSETVVGTLMLLNGDVQLEGFDISDPFIFYYKVRQAMTISDFRSQIFSKGAITSGTLSFDIQKAVDTNTANFNTILTTQISFNFATDANYTEKTAVINSSLAALAIGDVLRVEVKSVPTYFTGRCLMVIGAV